MEQINITGSFIGSLSEDVTKIIFNTLDAKELARCQQVSRHWHRDLVFLLDEVYFSSMLERYSKYYNDNVKKFNCRRIAYSTLDADWHSLVIKFPKLSHITINETIEHRHSPLQSFSDHKQIKTLHYDHLLAQEWRLDCLKTYTQLTELDIYLEVRLVDQLWEVLVGMPKLRKLSLRVRGANPLFSLNWKAISALESLKLVNNTFRPFDMQEGCDFGVMTNLTQLAIHGPYSGSVLSPLLLQHTRLQELTVDALSKDMLSMPMLQHLTSLKCNRALRVDETVPKLPNLVSLAWRPSTADEVDYISRHSNLTYLELRGTYYENVDKLLKLTKLKYLAIRVLLTKEIASVITKLPKLEAIDTMLPKDSPNVDEYKKSYRTFNLPDHLLALWTQNND